MIFLGAFLFRLIGIQWGLANDLHHQSYHPDELPVWAASQQVKPAEFKFTPGFYNYGTLYLTLERVATDVVKAYTPTPVDENSYWRQISEFHLAGRVLTALSGAAMAACLFALMRRWTSAFGAISGALLIAVAPAHVVHSRFQTVDIMAASFLAFSALFALRILPSPVDEEPPPVGRSAILSGLFAGLSTGTKYTGVLGLLTLWAALAIARPKGWLLEGVKGTAVCLLAFVVTTPGVLLDNAAFMRDFKFEMEHSKAGQIEFFHTQIGYLYHVSNLFVGVGFLMTLLGGAGLVVAAYKRRGWALALLAFFIPYFIVIGGSELKFIRYTFPLYVALAAGFAWAMGASHRKRGAYSILVVLGILGVGGMDSGGFRNALLDTVAMAGTDARDAAGAFLKTPEVGRGKTVGLVSDPWFWTPAVYRDAVLPRAAGPSAILSAMSATYDPKVVRSFYPNVDQRIDHWDVHLLTDLKPDYVTFSNFEAVDFERLKRSKNLNPLETLMVSRYEDFATKLRESYKPLRQFGSDSALVAGIVPDQAPDMMYISPVIQIWKRNDLP